MKHDHAASLAFLKWWLPEGPWCLAAIHPDERTKKDYITAEVFMPAAGDDAVLKWLGTHADKNLYYTANIAKPPADWALNRKNPRPTRGDLAAMICLHADVDPRAGEDVTAEQVRIKALLTAPRPKDLPPASLIVFTGGGYQILWRLKKPEPIRDAEHAEELSRYNTQVRNLLDGDSAQDVSRILRLPGTVNWPNKLKREKKGRVPALAFVVEQHDDRVYDLKGGFIPAPEVQSVESSAGRVGGGASRKVRRVEVSGNVRRLDDINELPDSVPGIVKVIIVQGDNPDNFKQFGGDRSRACWYVTCELVRQNVSDEIIFSVMTDPGFGISAHVLDQPRPEKYMLRQIERAHEHAIDPDLRAFNERFCVITNFGGRCRVVEESYDETLQRATLTSMTFDDLRNAFLNQRKELNDKDKMPLAEWWLRHPNRRQFDRVVFRPNEDEEIGGCYNLWRGFGVEPAPGDCGLFLSHVRDTLCRGDEDNYLYVLRWMARAVQYPAQPGQVAIVLKGRMGTGKSFFATTFGRLFGRHYLAVSDSKRLVSNFNSHLRDCVVLFADEAFYAGDKKHESILKALITESMLAIEAKGKDIEMGASCLHIIMSSNEGWAVPAAMDDRRFFVLDVGDDQRNAHKHFAQIQAQMEAGGYSALLHTLMAMDISTFNVRKRPETAALENEKLMSLGLVEAYWLECLQNGTLGLAETETAKWPLTVAKVLIYNEVRARLPGRDKSRSNISLGMTFRHLLPPEATQRDIRVMGTTRWRDHNGTERVATNTPGWALPSLDACRLHWEKQFGKPRQPWPNLEPVPGGVPADDGVPF